MPRRTPSPPQHGGLAATGWGLQHQPGVGHHVGDGHRVLPGGAQLGLELGGKQVNLGFQVELTFAVDDDFLDERAVPGGLFDGGDVDAALAGSGRPGRG